MDISTIREVFNTLSLDPSISLRKCASKFNISHTIVVKYINKLRAAGINNITDLNELKDDEVKKVLNINGKYDFIEPNWEEVLNYIYPPRANSKQQKRTYADAYEKIYLLETCKVDLSIEKEFPQGVMSRRTFERRVTMFKKEHPSNKSNLSDTASIEFNSKGSGMQIDGVGGVYTYHTRDKVTHEVRLLVSVLSYSGLVFIYAAPNATTKSWAELIIKSLEYFGGVPSTVHADNDVAISQKIKKFKKSNKRYLTNTPNPTMRYLSNVYGFEMILSNFGAPRNKGMIERVARLAQDSKLNCQVINKDYVVADNIEEYNQKLLKDVEFINNTNISNLDFSRKVFFESKEKKFLAPLPTLPVICQIPKTLHVSQRGYVRYQKADYFLGRKLVGKPVLCYEDGKNLVFKDVYTLKIIDTYEFDTAINPRIIRHKHEKYMREDEKVMQRTLESFKEEFKLKPYKFISELETLIVRIYSQKKLSLLDKSRNSNRIVGTCYQYAVFESKITQILKYINGIKETKYHEIINIIENLLDQDHSLEMPKTEETSTIPHSDLRGSSSYTD